MPHLRFPEFGGADAWSNKKLREIADVNASGDLDPENFSASKTNNHIYPIYSNSVSKKKKGFMGTVLIQGIQRIVSLLQLEVH